MSIKSDSWIRQMADDCKMIEPFEAEQISSMGADRIISYGTSSYGYDIRCSNEFKIFTNINSAVVDPKNFDEKSFIDFNIMPQLYFFTCSNNHPFLLKQITGDLSLAAKNKVLTSCL